MYNKEPIIRYVVRPRFGEDTTDKVKAAKEVYQFDSTVADPWEYSGATPEEAVEKYLEFINKKNNHE